MNKIFLLCGLDDENYVNPTFSFYEEYEEAKQAAIADCQEWLEGSDISIENNGNRIVGEADRKDGYEGSFYVNEIFEIDLTKGNYLVIWYHGYNGVDFKKIYQCNSFEACEAERERLINMIVDNPSEITKWDNSYIIDTGNEWEGYSIIGIPSWMI